MKNLYLLVLLIFGNNTFSMIIDNLDDKRANWSAISDNVMGGISEVNFYEVEEGEEKFYRLEGTVSTANNGGFIQSVIRYPFNACLLYTSPSPRDRQKSRMPSSA